MLAVRNIGRNQYAVFDGADQVSGKFNYDGAHSRLDEIAGQRRQASRQRTRACLCCGRAFESEGAHNRMCVPCRGRASRLGGEWQ